MEIQELINQIRDHGYMEGIIRDESRIKQTGEFFTPTWLVQYSLEKIEQFVITTPVNKFKIRKTHGMKWKK